MTGWLLSRLRGHILICTGLISIKSSKSSVLRFSQSPQQSTKSSMYMIHPRTSLVLHPRLKFPGIQHNRITKPIDRPKAKTGEIHVLPHRDKVDRDHISKTSIQPSIRSRLPRHICNRIVEHLDTIKYSKGDRMASRNPTLGPFHALSNQLIINHGIQSVVERDS